jgi:hypothetical protein
MAKMTIDRDTLIPLGLVVALLGATYSMGMYLEGIKQEIKRASEDRVTMRNIFVSRADLLLWIESTRASNRELTLPPLGRQ